MTLDDVLMPIGTSAFLQKYVSRDYVLIRGDSHRYRPLVTWDDLNDVLSRLDIGDRRVSLVKQGQGLPLDSYTCSSRDGKVRWLNGPLVTSHIASGATLVVNHADMLLPPLRRLAESCEDVFEIPVGANLYAGWRTDNGFEVHWDTHDTLILQVTGSKDWKVWKPTRLHPLRDDRLEIVPAPQDAPIWQGTLEAGDLLYMPRGWWHVAFPRDEASLHITLGIALRTGADLIEWAIERIRESIDVREDVPHWQSHEAKAAWMQSVRRACSEILNDNAIDAYMRGLTENAKPRSHVCLSDKIVASVLTDQNRLRLVQGRRLLLEPNDGADATSFVVQGTEWRCPVGVAPALLLLNHNRPCTLLDMERSIEPAARPLLRPFVTALLMAGVIWVAP